MGRLGHDGPPSNVPVNDTNHASTSYEEMLDEELLDEVLNYFIHVEKKTLYLVQNGVKRKADLLNEVDEYLIKNKVKSGRRKKVKEDFIRFIWGYYVLEEVINDKDVSDIKILSEDNVRVKRKGKRMGSDVKFRDKEDYKRFVDMVAAKNKTNLSDINAVQSFTDKESNGNYILRFNIATDFVNSTDVPYLHIRKIAKDKYSMEELIALGMLDEEKAAYLSNRAAKSSGIIFTGKGASGKTTLMNVLLEHIPHESSGLVIQENEELFSEGHPDIMFQHVVASKGEGKIQYSLKDLARNGLLTDLDYFIIGEVKGGEALYLLNASYTGHKCWASVHGMNSMEAMNKLADYVKYESDYSRSDILSMLVALQTIVYMEDFQVKEITEVLGYENGGLVYQMVYGSK